MKYVFLLIISHAILLTASAQIDLSQLANSLLSEILSDPSVNIPSIANKAEMAYLSVPESIRKSKNYIITLQDSIPDAIIGKISSVLEKLEFKVITHFSKTFKGFHVTLDIELPLDFMRKIPFIKSIEEDYVMEITQVQNLPSDDRFWSLDRLDQANLPLNHQYEFRLSGEGVHAYILDSGIQLNHPEFEGRASTVFVSSLLKGADDGDDTNNIDDCTGHGTHVAGIVGGLNVGIAKKVTLLAMRIIGCDNKSSNSQVLEALEWLSTNIKLPAVINMSLGPTRENGAYQRSPALDSAIAVLIAKGATVVVAAGNDDADPCQGSPAGSTGVITVGAIDMNDKRTWYSNTGSCVDLFAPGAMILSSVLPDTYDTKSGTSQATPHVSGVVALMLQHNKAGDSAYIREALLATAVLGKVVDTKRSRNYLLQTINAEGYDVLINLGDAGKIRALSDKNPFYGPYAVYIKVSIAVGCIAVLALVGYLLARLIMKCREPSKSFSQKLGDVEAPRDRRSNDSARQKSTNLQPPPPPPVAPPPPPPLQKSNDIPKPRMKPRVPRTDRPPSSPDLVRQLAIAKNRKELENNRRKTITVNSSSKAPESQRPEQLKEKDVERKRRKTSHPELHVLPQAETKPRKLSYPEILRF